MIADRCRSGQGCVALTSDGSAITTRPLCQRCVDQIQERLDQLPELRNILPMFKGGLWGTSGEAKVSSSSGPVIPLNVHVLDLIDDIDELIYQVGGLRVADLINQPDGVSWAMAVRKAWKQADDIIGLFPRTWSRRFTPCPECHLRTLGSFDGIMLGNKPTADDNVQCSSCGYSMSRDEYDNHTLVTARAERIGIQKAID